MPNNRKLIGAIEAGRSTARIFVENDEPHILLAEMLLYPRTDLIEGVLLMKFALGALLARANVHNGENYGFSLLHNGTGVGTSTGAATRISLHSTRTPCGYDSPLEVRKAIPTDNLLAPLGLSILVQEITGQTRDILLGLIGYYAAIGAAATTAPKTVSDSDTGALPRGNGELILVIEDDADLRSLTTGMIEGLGYRVIAVPEAASGLATLQREQVDMVLPDVVLPGGMSGPEFAKVAHERDPALKVAFMSGYASEAAGHDALQEPTLILLNKPFRRHQLAKALLDTLGAEETFSKERQQTVKPLGVACCG